MSGKFAWMLCNGVDPVAEHTVLPCEVLLALDGVLALADEQALPGDEVGVAKSITCLRLSVIE